MGNEHHIRVIVAGGGVVGLTLANALEVSHSCDHENTFRFS